jgi:hypothetical protein
MRQNNLNQESGLAIGSAGEIKYKKEMDSIRKVEEKSDAKKQKKRNRFHRCERKSIPKQLIFPIRKRVHWGNVTEQHNRSGQ